MMTETFPIPWMEPEKVREHADRFLGEYHPDLTFPVPIEEIAEFQLGLIFATVSDLKDEYDIDGFLSADLTTLYIDEFIYLQRENRSRFTVAHEIGHFVLHPQASIVHAPKTRDEWKAYVRSVPDRNRRSMEWQSNSFGGVDPRSD